MQLSQFEGRWRIARRIEDQWMGTTGLFDGVARFVADGQGLAYHETGELRLPQEAPMAASQKFLWQQDGADIAVRYADGRQFHRIAAGSRVVHDRHECAPDDYEVTYNFTNWPEWRMIWKVRGPRKDYVSISDFTRL